MLVCSVSKFLGESGDGGVKLGFFGREKVGGVALLFL